VAHNHLDACPSLESGRFEDCSCLAEEIRYITLAKWSLGIFSLESLGGYFSGSIALMSDSLHVLVDGTENIVNAIVSRLSRQSDREMRLRKRGGVISALLLLIAGGWIVVEGINRISSPHKVEWYMTLVAVLGLGGNLVQRWIHQKAPKEHRNIQHFFQDLHIWGDILSSLAVILGGTVMLATENLYWVDGALSIIIGIWIIIITTMRLFGKKHQCGDHPHHH